MTKQWPVWRTMKIGTRTAADYRAELEANRVRRGIEDWGHKDDAVSSPSFTVSATEIEIKLVELSVAELGFQKGATGADIYARAKEQGLELCPPEVGPCLLLGPQDRSRVWVTMAMEPIRGRDGVLCVWGLQNNDDGGLTLTLNHGRPDFFWGCHYRFVFVGSAA